MTNKGPGSGSEWVDGDILNADDLLDTMSANDWKQFVSPLDNTNKIRGIISHSTTTFSVILDSGAIHQSTDTLLTFTSKNTDLDTNSFIKVCKADRTHGVVVENQSSGEVAFTSDFGTTWTTKTSTAFGTKVYDVSFPTGALIVVGGDDAGGTDHVVYSTNDGGTWTNASVSPDTRVYALDMFDGTTGYAVDSADKIWKTTDSGDNWVDTTHTTGNTAETDMSIYAISSTVVIIQIAGLLWYYDNGTGNSTLKASPSDVNKSMGTTQTENGNIYTGACSTTGDHIFIWKSTNSGVDWGLRTFSSEDFDDVDASKNWIHAYDGGLIVVWGNKSAINIIEED